MKLILTLLGVVLLVVAAVYFLVPADQLPGFFPGHEAGVTHARQARHRVRRRRRRAARRRRLDGAAVSGDAAARPSGGVTRMSRRVMNLAHLVTQNARRHGDRIGFIWGERSWTWREIDAQVSALAAALAARGIVKGDRILVHSKNCDEMFWSMFAAFRLGAVWVPTNFRLMPDEVAYLATASGAKAFLCHGDFPDHAAAVKRRARRWRSPGGSARARFGETIGARGDRRACRREDRRTPRSTTTIPAGSSSPRAPPAAPRPAVLTHGQMAFVVTNHLADLMPGTTEHDASLVVAPLSHGAGVHQLVQTARGVPTILLPSETLRHRRGVPR